tara:strand:- start:392 stop:871 length:480 start_codon:yes stop_codon:yes gene_type:complete
MTNNQLTPAVLCDIDGTIALMNFKRRSPFEYEKAFSDRLNKPVAQVVKSIIEGWRYKLIFFSAREDKTFSPGSPYKSTYHLTYEWITQNFGTSTDWGWDLHLREEGNHNKDCYVKYDMYKEHIEGKYDVRYVFDDRNQVVDMWRNGLGLTCLQVADGNF